MTAMYTNDRITKSLDMSFPMTRQSFVKGACANGHHTIRTGLMLADFVPLF